MLSILSKNMIYSILDQYKHLSSSKNGIPRGVGISAFLSEIYMKDIDARFKKTENIFFYARYVDDIIVVTDNEHASSIKTCIINELNEIKLKINEEKTKTIKFTKESQDSFDYLGYSFSKNTIGLSEKRINKYRSKIDLAFADFEKKRKTKRRKAIQLLIKRIKYLTFNTKLKKSKSSILTGVYFNNLLLENKQQLDDLDRYLIEKIDTIKSKLKSKLLKFSFSKGFSNKKFYNFSLEDLSEITKIWKDI